MQKLSIEDRVVYFIERTWATGQGLLWRFFPSFFLIVFWISLIAGGIVALAGGAFWLTASLTFGACFALGLLVLVLVALADTIVAYEGPVVGHSGRCTYYW